MPPAAGGSAPGLDLENNDACWRAKPRANRRHCFLGFLGGSWAGLGFFLLTFTSAIADDCR